MAQSMGYQSIWEQIRQLPPADKQRLLRQLTTDLQSCPQNSSPQQRSSTIGCFAGTGSAPTQADIRQLRREVWRAGGSS